MLNTQNGFAVLCIPFQQISSGGEALWKFRKLVRPPVPSGTAWWLPSTETTMRCTGAKYFPGVPMTSRHPVPALSADIAAPAIGTAETPCFEYPAQASALPLKSLTPMASLMACLCWLVPCTWMENPSGQTMLTPTIFRTIFLGPRWRLDLRSTTPRTGFGPSKLAASSSRTGICSKTSPGRTSGNRNFAKRRRRR